MDFSIWSLRLVLGPFLYSIVACTCLMDDERAKFFDRISIRYDVGTTMKASTV